jgi:mevalonate kinase
MTFRSNGKLLLTSEYLVLNGAKALALPCKLGQSLVVEGTEEPNVYWESYDVDNNCWFKAEVNVAQNQVILTSDRSIAAGLLDVLCKATQINPEFKPDQHIVKTYLEFDQKWGLGSSSTLRINIANWANCSPYQLHDKTSNGSGYDIAAGLSDTPILFSNSNGFSSNECEFNPVFNSNLFFIHLNQKQISSSEVIAYQDTVADLDLDYCISVVESLTNKIIESTNLVTFEEAIQEHELVLSSILQRESVGETHFSDYNLGAVKSLGGWGGDFILATGPNVIVVKEYFNQKGYHTVLEYSELIR